MARIATNPDTGERVQLNEQTGEWEPIAAVAPTPRPETPGLAQSAMAGASRGVLDLLDVPARGVAGAYNVINRMLPGGMQGPPLDVSPARRIAGMAGIGTTQPVTPGEEHAAFAGEMVGSSLLPAGLATRVAGLPGLASEAVATAGATLGGMASEEMGAGRATGALAGGLAPTGASALMRGAMLPRQSAQAPGRVAAAERQGLPISVGQATGGSWLERTTETLPGGATAKAGFAQNQADLMRQRLQQISAGARGAQEPGAMTAGATISQGIDDWATRFKAQTSELYEAAEDVVPRATQLEPDNLRRTVSELHGTGAFAGLTDNPLTERLATTLDELPEGAVTYNDMRELRSMIGRQLSTPSIIADAPRAELKQLYKSLTQDMQDAVERVGGDEAIEAWKRADEAWKSGMKRVDNILGPIQRRKTPEEVYKAAMAGTKEGSTKIRELRDTLTPEQWDVVRRTAMRKLGEMPPGTQTLESATAVSGEFSAERFMTNMGKIGEDARNILFEGQPNLDDLANVASGIQEAANYMRNPSGTARMIAQGLVPAAGVAAYYDPSLATGIGGLIGSAYGAQKFLQSPAGVQWATQPPPLAQRGLFGLLPRTEAASQ